MTDDNASAPPDGAHILETIQEINDLMMEMRSDLANAKSEDNN